MGGNGGGTGARPAGKRDARPALPHPHPQAVGADQAGKLHIGALGEQGVMLIARADQRQVHILGVLDEEHAMRVAHAQRDRIARQGQVGSIDRLGQRHLGPVELRLPHVHRHPAIRQAHRRQPAALGDQRNRLRARARHDVVRHAARGIAAGPGPAAIIVPEIQREIGRVAVADLGQLVEANAPVAVAQGARQRWRDHGLTAPPARVDHHEIIACPVHFHEAQAGRGCLIHHRPHIRPRPTSCQRPAESPLHLLVVGSIAPPHGWAVSSVGRAADS